MKPTSETLFQLVHSLNKNEKGYFVKWASQFKQNRDADYIILFKEIGESDRYNEDQLKEIMIKKGARTVFSSLKKYLYDQLLLCLTEYHKRNNTEIQLYVALSKIEMLYQKGLYKACYSLICQTEKKCTDLSLLFKLNVIKNELGRFIQINGFLQDNIGRKIIIQEQLIYFTSIINSFLNSSRSLRTVEEKEQIFTIKKKIKQLDIDLINEDINLNLQFNKVNFLICFIEEQYSIGNVYAQNLKQLLPILLKRKENEYNPYSIIEIYHYMLRSARRLYSFEDVFLIIKELQNIDIEKIKVPKTKNYLWNILAIFKTDALLFTGNIESSVSYSTQVIKDFPKYQKNVDVIYEIIHIENHFLALFLSYQFKNAAKLSSRFLIKNELDKRKETILELWILLIVCKIELTEFEQAKKHLYKLEEYIQNDKTLIHNNDIKEFIQLLNISIKRRASFIEVKSPIVNRSLTTLEKKLKTRKYEYLWGVTVWLKSKIEETTMEHAIKRLNEVIKS